MRKLKQDGEKFFATKSAKQDKIKKKYRIWGGYHSLLNILGYGSLYVYISFGVELLISLVCCFLPVFGVKVVTNDDKIYWFLLWGALFLICAFALYTTFVLQTLSIDGIKSFRLFRKTIEVSWEDVRLIDYQEMPYSRTYSLKPYEKKPGPMLIYIYLYDVSERDLIFEPFKRKKVGKVFVFPAKRKNMRILVEIASKLPYEKLRGKFQHDNLNNVVVATILGKHKK